MKKRTKKTIGVSFQVVLRLVLATVLCIILHASVMAIAVNVDAFRQEAGYQITENENSDVISHMYADGEKHITQADLEKGQELVIIYGVKPAVQVVAQVLMLIVLAVFPYHIMWEFGNRDDTKVRYKGQRLDLYRGFRVGAFAMVPYAVLWVLLFAAKWGILPNGYGQVYRLALYPFMPFVSWVMPNGSLAETEVWRIFALLPILLFIPIVCGISYRLGHNQFSIREHLVFAKKKEANKDI